MPRTKDLAQIRASLHTDRAWCVYALGDLSPGYCEHCDWHVARGQAPAVVLLYRERELPVLFVHGDPATVEPLLDELPPLEGISLSVRPRVLPLIRARATVATATPMWRMVLTRANFRPVDSEETVPLTGADLPALQRLYLDGAASGERPDFFYADMVLGGVFFGVYEGDELVSAAGTHLVAASESVAAVGNVYTRLDRRRRGLARRVTSAVTAELLGRGIDLVALSVGRRNEAAKSTYAALGFRRHCAFVEGTAREWRAESGGG